MLEKLIYSFGISAEAIAHNKTRALLTSLGIIFGVASVIAMLAIGAGAQREILNQIKLLGAQNVIVTPVTKQEEAQVGDEGADSGEGDESSGGNEDENEKRPFTPGLTLADAQSIAAMIPGVEWVSPEVIYETSAVRAGLRRSAKLVGVDAPYFEDGQFTLEKGSFFTEEHLRNAEPVAIIGSKAKLRFFPKEEAIGKRIKCGTLWLTVIGVLEPRHLESQAIDHLGLRNFNYDIYAPIQTVLLRYKNRASLSKRDVERASRRRRASSQDENYHQVDRMVVRVASTDLVKPVAEVVTRMLQRRHYNTVDYQVTVPEVLLQQERRTQSIFNIVLASIASISLIVGGIGIMNIMLASVMERIKEIGIRRSMGATRDDVVMQFLIEAITISFTGGIIGILLGVGVSLTIQQTTGIPTVISWHSVVLSFAVSVSIGLIFGLLPAKRAAQHDPVVALRYE